MKRPSLVDMPLAKVAQALYKAIDQTKNREVLKALSYITYDLQPVLDFELTIGVGRELDLWVGLKLDAPNMGARYGEGIKEGYSDIFGDSEDQHDRHRR